MLPPFLTGSDKLEWDNVAGESASPMLLLLHTSLTAYKVPPFTKWGWLFSCFMQQDSSSINVVYPFKMSLYLIQNELSIPCMLSDVIVHFSNWHFVSSWNHLSVSHCKWILILLAVLIIPNNHDHWDSTVLCWKHPIHKIWMEKKKKLHQCNTVIKFKNE